MDPKLLVRRINLTAARVCDERTAADCRTYEQLDLFAEDERQEEREFSLEREKRRQQAVIHIKKKYGKNAIIKGMNLEEGATAMDRNRQIGGHKA